MTAITNARLVEMFEGQRLMAILRGFGAERSVELAQQAWTLGIDFLEAAMKQGLTCLKAFPAALLGPAWFWQMAVLRSPTPSNSLASPPSPAPSSYSAPVESEESASEGGISPPGSSDSTKNLGRLTQFGPRLSAEPEPESVRLLLA